MATLSIKDSREFLIFQAFSGNKSYESALKDLEKYDAENPSKRIFASSDEKKAMQGSYQLFKEVEQIIERGGLALDYDNPLVIERMKTILSQKLPAVSREVLKEETASMAINKANIGRMMARHALNLKTVGKKALYEQSKPAHSQAMVDKHRPLGHSPHEKVISTEKTYRRNEEVLLERILKEQQESDKK